MNLLNKMLQNEHCRAIFANTKTFLAKCILAFVLLYYWLFRQKFQFCRKLNVLLQKFENEDLGYKKSHIDTRSFSDIGRGDVILSRSNHIRVTLRAHYPGNGILASFQAGKFL